MADEHGHVIYLGERECSIQRRHQKVMEEAPSPVVDARDARSAWARLRCGRPRSRNIPTLAPSSSWSIKRGNFYFLEMNTRLQVEHPVTELVTGFDLVQMQIAIAAGEKLAVRQEDVRIRGHAIECRIYAEDPDNDYFPSPGRITRIIAPAGPGIRRDSGVYEGWTVSHRIRSAAGEAERVWLPRATTPLIACAARWWNILSAASRPTFRCSAAFCWDPAFQAGNFDTGFLDRLLSVPDMSAPACEFRLRPSPRPSSRRWRAGVDRRYLR